MTDRELLQFVAKAAGVYLEWDGPPNQWQPMYYKGKTYHSWNPLVDDGDAMRLAVKLDMDVEVLLDQGITMIHTDTTTSQTEPHNNDPYAATRRAIVRAAAEIGKEQK